MPTVPEIITSNIIDQLERGVAPWRKPWSTSIPRNLISKKPYRGLNVFLLATQGYDSPYWLTFNQAKQLGAHVRKGEKSTLVSFWKFSEYTRENEAGETENKASVLLRYYHVFNIEQCEGLKALHGNEHKPVSQLVECDSIANGMPNPPRFEQHSQAFYRPSADVVGMPSPGCFESPEVCPVECVSSWKSVLYQFGSESYSKEELIAEMGAAMLAGMAGISQATLGNSPRTCKRGFSGSNPIRG